MSNKIGKTILLLLITCLLVCAFAACDGKSDNSSGQNGVSVNPGSNLYAHRVLSGSMEPALHMGHTYRYKLTDAEMTFQVGDIVLVYYTVEGYDPIHAPRRIVEIAVSDDDTLYTMQGDANPFPDASPYRREDIIGKFVEEEN